MKTVFYHFQDEIYAARTVNDGYMPDSVHFHTYYELSVVRGGRLHIVCGDAATVYDKPCVLLFRPHCFHEIMSERGIHFDCTSFHFSGDFVQRFEDKLIDIRALFSSDLTVIPLSAAMMTALQPLMDSYAANDDQPTLCRLLLAGMLEIVRIHMDEALDPSASANAGLPRQRYIHQVVDYIAGRFGDALTSEQIAKAFYISRQKLDADFKSVMKTTLRQYLLDIRTANAAQMLSDGKSVTEVTEFCGFANESHFIRTFKLRFGVSPYRFQKQCGTLITEQSSRLYAHPLQESAIIRAHHPITGGKTYFGQAEFMYTGEPTALRPWCNAFCRAGWTGSSWYATTMDGVDCICVMPVQGSGEWHILDFNYYQWNNDVYYPSLNCAEYGCLKVRFRLNRAAAKSAGVSRFYVSPDMKKLGMTLDRKREFTSYIEYTMPREPDVWHTLILDLTKIRIGGEPWETKTVRQFRFLPFGLAKPSPDALCYMESMEFFADCEAALNASASPVV